MENKFCFVSQEARVWILITLVSSYIVCCFHFSFFCLFRFEAVFVRCGAVDPRMKINFILKSSFFELDLAAWVSRQRSTTHPFVSSAMSSSHIHTNNMWNRRKHIHDTCGFSMDTTMSQHTIYELLDMRIFCNARRDGSPVPETRHRWRHERSKERKRKAEEK